jgi:hypothetical protein
MLLQRPYGHLSHHHLVSAKMRKQKSCRRQVAIKDDVSGSININTWVRQKHETNSTISCFFLFTHRVDDSYYGEWRDPFLRVLGLYYSVQPLCQINDEIAAARCIEGADFDKDIFIASWVIPIGWRDGLHRMRSVWVMSGERYVDPYLRESPLYPLSRGSHVNLSNVSKYLYSHIHHLIF